MLCRSTFCASIAIALLLCDCLAHAEPIRCVSPNGTPLLTVALSPDGKMVVGGGPDDGSAHVWDATNGKELFQLPCYEPGSTDRMRGIYAVAFTPAVQFGREGGEWIAVGASGKPITFWNRLGVKYKDVIENERITTFAFSADGSKLAVGQYWDITVWAMEDRRKLNVFPLDKRVISLPLSVAFSPDGTMVAAGLRDNGNEPAIETSLVHIWELPKGNEILNIWKYHDVADTVTFSPDGKLLAMGGGHDGKLEIWDVKAQKLVQSIPAGKSGLLCVAFNPDGKTIASAGSGSEIKFWDVQSGQLIGLLKGHTNQVYAVSFSKDGKKLASAGGSDKSILVWNLETDSTKPTDVEERGGK